MCGRYAFFETERMYERFEVRRKLELEPRYNAAPGQFLPVIIMAAEREAVPMKWGLLPSWAKESKLGYKMINARIETLIQKPTYRVLLSRQRCLVPANGFFEWQREKGKKKPYYIRRRDQDLLALAGLYNNWQGRDGEMIPSFTIITTEARGRMTEIHDRMPLMLDREAEGRWLNPDISEPEVAMKELDEIEVKSIEWQPVSTAVNRPMNDTPEIIQPVK